MVGVVALSTATNATAIGVSSNDSSISLAAVVVAAALVAFVVYRRT